MANKIGSLAVQITGSTTGLAASLKDASDKLNTFKNKTDKAGRAAISSRPEPLAKSAGSSGNSLAGSIASGMGFGPLGMLAGGLGAAMGVGELSKMVHSSIMFAAEMEDSTTTFKVMLGDMGKAKTLMADITKLAAETPLTTQELVQSGGMLLSADVSADQIVPSLRMLGDVAAGVRQPLNEVVYLYNQVRTQGRLYGDDLRQFTGRGIPLIAAFASTMGVSESAVKGLVEEGRIGFPELQTALLSMTSSGGKFYGMMEERSKTFNGMLSTLADNWQQLGAKLGQALIEEFELKPLMQRLTLFADDAEGIVDWLRPLFSSLKDVFAGAGSALVDQLVQGVILAGDLADKFAQVADKAELAANFTKGLLGGRGQANNDEIRNSVAAKSVLNLLHGGQKSGTAGLFRGAGAFGGWESQSGDWTSRAADLRDVMRDAFGNLNQPLDSNFLFERRVRKDSREMWKTLKDTPLAFGIDAKELAFSVASTKALGESFGWLGKSIASVDVETRKLTDDQNKRVRSVREELNPFLKIGRELGELDSIRKLGGFAAGGTAAMFRTLPNDAFNFAQSKAINPLVEKYLDLGSTAKMASSALAGSVEAASIINTSRMEGRQNFEQQILAGMAAEKEIQQQQTALMNEFVAIAKKAGLIEVK